jgi:spore maturation protein CgeB
VSGLFEANLRALAAQNPARAARVAEAHPAGVVEPAASGEPTLVADGVLLHSRWDPRAEAARWAADACANSAPGGEPAATAVVFGMGLGYHVEALATRWPGRIVVVEPDDGLVRTALEVRDLRSLLERVELAPEAIGRAAIAAWGPAVLLRHAPSLLREAAALREPFERAAGFLALDQLRLRVLVVSPLGGGSHPIAGYCARALTELGHTVRLLDLAPLEPGMAAAAQFTPQRRARRVVEAAYTRFLATGILAAVQAFEPDLVLALAQAPLDAEALAEIGRRGVVRAFWFVEDHRLFPYWRDVIAGYDYFCAIQESFLAEAATLTAGRVCYLPCAADPGIHRPLDLTPAERTAFGAPVAFVGAGYRNRRISFAPLLDLGLRLWGTEWENSGVMLSALERGGARIPTEDAVRIFNATSVNLNLHSSTWVDGVDPRGDFVNPRTFELAAAGAFQLVDRRALLPALFVPDVEVATFTAASELRERVRYYLAHPDERAAIAAAGRARVLAEHTYRHRMETLLALVCGHEHERLRARARQATVAEVARREAGTPLGGLLETLPPATPFTLDGIAAALAGRRGDLSDPEAILLFLHEFDEMYVREARA